MISRQPSGLETILREMCFRKIRPGLPSGSLPRSGGKFGVFSGTVRRKAKLTAKVAPVPRSVTPFAIIISRPPDPISGWRR